MAQSQTVELSYEYLNQARKGLAPHPYAASIAWTRNINAFRTWLERCQLTDKQVLEVGVGSGKLQDAVSGYIGLDIELAFAQYFHAPFVNGSALAMPFADNTFDGAWSIWVLEHISEPEQMLAEMRRVVKPDGSIFLCVAYSVDSWIAQGLHKRAFSELSLRQRLIKTTIPLRQTKAYKSITRLAYRMLDLWRYQRRLGQTSLRYRKLVPNFETYWDYDADACASIDAYSVALYFLSRGDQSLYPAGVVRSLLQQSQPQAFIINKPAVISTGQN